MAITRRYTQRARSPRFDLYDTDSNRHYAAYDIGSDGSTRYLEMVDAFDRRFYMVRIGDEAASIAFSLTRMESVFFNNMGGGLSREAMEVRQGISSRVSVTEDYDVDTSRLFYHGFMLERGMFASAAIEAGISGLSPHEREVSYGMAWATVPCAKINDNVLDNRLDMLNLEVPNVIGMGSEEFAERAERVLNDDNDSAWAVYEINYSLLIRRQ